MPSDSAPARAHAPPILMISGQTPPGGCGVEDYTARLVQALRERGLSVMHEHVTSLTDVPRVLRAARAGGAVAHLQYPVLSWRTSWIPVAIAAALRWTTPARLAVTLHEFSRVHVLRRAICAALGRISNDWIATTEGEATSAGPWLGGAPRRVIPIASNIASPIARLGEKPRPPRLLFFGLLAPSKGLEQFLELARRLPSDSDVEVVGRPVAGREGWIDEMLRRFPGVTFRLGLDDSDVSRALALGTVAFLPFPDGISERRGSALAALAHGLQVVTTAGPGTTAELARVTHVVSGAEEALATVSGLLDGSVAPRDGHVVQAYLARRTWPEIARAHEGAYCALVAGRRLGGSETRDR